MRGREIVECPFHRHDQNEIARKSTNNRCAYLAHHSRPVRLVALCTLRSATAYPFAARFKCASPAKLVSVSGRTHARVGEEHKDCYSRRHPLLASQISPRRIRRCDPISQSQIPYRIGLCRISPPERWQLRRPQLCPHV